MTYTKPGWTPVTTELNDPPWKGPEKDLLPGIIKHLDWCEDKTCWCHDPRTA